MKFLADENVREPIVAAIRAEGHDVLRVSDEQPSILDPDVLAKARATERILLTHDLDFGRLLFGDNLAPPVGVIQFRFPSDMRYAEMARIAVAALRTGHAFRGYFTTDDERQVRFRPLPPAP